MLHDSTHHMLGVEFGTQNMESTAERGVSGVTLHNKTQVWAVQRL